MYVLDPIGDMIARIRNAYGRRRGRVEVPVSRMRADVLKVLQDEGYIQSFAESQNGLRKMFVVALKYHDGAPVIQQMKRISKPSRRVYSAVKNLPRVFNGLGVSILSTPKGIMSDVSARKLNVGGEVLFTVF